MDINEEIRALSWKQPFASLMLHGKVETRTWDTKYRGLVLICASKQAYGGRHIKTICGDEQFKRVQSLFQHRDMELVDGCGNAIAVGKLIDCRKMEPEDEDACFVKYQSQLWCHIYEDVKLIKYFPWKGSQGWRKLDQPTIDKIEYLK